MFLLDTVYRLHDIDWKQIGAFATTACSYFVYVKSITEARVKIFYAYAGSLMFHEICFYVKENCCLIHL